MKKLKCVFLTAIVGVMISSLSFAGIDDGLVAYYPFNGNANDSSGNGNHGTVHGATLTADRFGNANSAYNIIDTQFISLNNSTLNNRIDFTISCWIKFDIINSDVNMILGVANFSEDNEFNLFYDSPNNFGIDLKGTTYINFSGSVDVEDNNWHFVAFTRMDNLGILYVDNAKISEIIISNTIIKSAQNGVVLGQDQDCVGGCFEASQNLNGKLDDIRIYNRTLSDIEIFELYVRNNQPVANAGHNQVVCNEVCNGAVLDGRKSYDPNGEIVSYVWELKHRENSSYDITANGETPAIFNLEPGVYDTMLTITDDVNLTDTDEMILEVLDTCNTCSIMKGDLDGDGDVDGNDLLIFSQHYGTIPLTP